MTLAVNIAQGGANNVSFRNRIINGAMVIDQRNAGASVATSSGTNVYTLDRWQVYYTSTNKYTVQQNAGSVTPLVGFTNYLGITSSAATTVGSTDLFLIYHRIEGFNCADLGWGTANAKTVTLSFQVYSSLTGTFGGTVNSNAGTYSYPFSYSIPVANTWTTISVTIPGATAGTWGTGNSGCIQLNFGLGVGSTYNGTAGSWSANTYYGATGATSVVGTNGATFYITGVQLEAGTTASPFEYRQYGTELALCQRYYQESCSVVTTTGQYLNHLRLPVSMRIGPSVGAITFDSGTGATFGLVANTGGGTAGLSLYQASNHSAIATATKIPLSAEL